MDEPQTRKQKRVVAATKVSCTECYRRRQRCDSQRPCPRCVQRGVGHLCIDRTHIIRETCKSTDSSLAASSMEISSMDGMVIYLDQTEMKNAHGLLGQIKDDGKGQFDRSVMVQQLVLYSRAPWITNVFGNGLPGGKIALRNDVFYSTLWSIQPPEEWRDHIRGYYFEKSADFLANTLLTNPISWRLLLSNCEGLFGITGTEVFHKSVIRKAISSEDISETDKELIQAMQNYVRFDYFKASVALMCNPAIEMSLEEEEIVKTLFNIETITGSDIAILKSYELMDQSGQWINTLVECNPALENLLGVSMKVIADIVYALKDIPIFGALFWSFDVKHWPMLFEFSIGSTFKRPTWITEIVDLRTSTGASISCLMHAFASYDKPSGVRTSRTFCIKPLSPTFKPKLLVTQL
jgi:hypothetical protein